MSVKIKRVKKASALMLLLFLAMIGSTILIIWLTITLVPPGPYHVKMAGIQLDWQGGLGLFQYVISLTAGILSIIFFLIVIRTYLAPPKPIGV